MSWQKNQALVMADCLDSNSEKALEFAPRQMLKSLASPAFQASQVQFSMSFAKQASGADKEEPKHHSSSNRGLLTFEQGALGSEIVNELRKTLQDVGIPIESLESHGDGS